MHHQVRIRDTCMDFLDPLDRENVAGRLARELVRAVRSADRDCKRIDVGLGDEVGRLLGIGEQHVMRELSRRTGAILVSGVPGLERTQATELAFHRYADPVCGLRHLGGDSDVVFVRRRRLHVALERAIHHH